MDQPGLMSPYLLLQCSPFLVQSWGTMLQNKRMGKNMVRADKMAKPALPFLFIVAVHFFIIELAPLSPRSLHPHLLFALFIYILVG